MNLTTIILTQLACELNINTPPRMQISVHKKGWMDEEGIFFPPQEKIPKIQPLFYLVFPWIHQYPCSDESQVWIEPGFFLDYFVQYRKSVIFPALDIKKTGFNLDF